MADLDCSVVFEPHPTGKRFIDMTGHVNGRLTVIGYAGRRGHSARWYCKCECGTIKAFSAHAIKSNTSRSCGCLRKEITRKRTALDLTGHVYGRLTVLSFVGRVGNASHWLCKCECGTVKNYHLGALRSGHTQSCGCLWMESVKASNTTHGHSIGRQLTPEFKTYRGILRRCNEKTAVGYEYYGGRGIKCKFESFLEFFEHVGKKPSKNHSIDRIDNDGHYEKGNVRWATMKQQANNKRTTLKILLKGESKSLAEWLGNCRAKAYRRAGYKIRKGVDPAHAVILHMEK